MCTSLHLKSKIQGFFPRCRITTFNTRGLIPGDKIGPTNFEVSDNQFMLMKMFCLCPYIYLPANFINIRLRERTDIYKLGLEAQFLV